MVKEDILIISTQDEMELNKTMPSKFCKTILLQIFLYNSFFLLLFLTDTYLLRLNQNLKLQVVLKMLDTYGMAMLSTTTLGPDFRSPRVGQSPHALEKATARDVVKWAAACGQGVQDTSVFPGDGLTGA